MKKKVTNLLPLLLFIFNAQAQTKSSVKDVRFGIKGGYNLSAVLSENLFNAYDYEPEQEPLSGFHLGAFVEIPLTRKFSIQPEVMYSTKGYKESFYEYNYYNGYNTIYTNYDLRVHLNYINVPILAKVNFTKNFALEAGPQFGFLTSAKAKGDIWDGYKSVTINENIKNNVNDFEFGFAIGVTYSFVENIFISARINQSLTNNFPDNSYEANMTFQLSAGYKF